MAGPSQSGAPLADWRHLGLIPRAGKALVIGGDYPDLRPVFEVVEVRSWSEIPEPPASYQLIVVCSRIESPDPVVGIERILDPAEGVAVLLVPSGPPGSRRYRPLAFRTRSTRKQFQGSRLEPYAVFGAIPDPRAPEYVFPLTKAAAGFAIERFVLSRRPTWGWMTRALRVGPLTRLAMWTLPGGLILCRIGVARP